MGSLGEAGGKEMVLNASNPIVIELNRLENLLRGVFNYLILNTFFDGNLWFLKQHKLLFGYFSDENSAWNNMFLSFYC